MDTTGKAIIAATAICFLGLNVYKMLQNIEEKKAKKTDTHAETKYILLKEELLKELINDIEQMKSTNIVHVNHLSEWCGMPKEVLPNPLLMKSDERFRAQVGSRLALPPESLVPPGTFCIKDYQFETEDALKNAQRYMKAGPKKYCYFNKEEVKAAIVTCGGLCPGLNVVIREIVMTLWFNYKVKEIWGVRWGYSGFYCAGQNYVTLNPEKVKDIHQLGGSVLGAGRDEFKADKILDAIVERNINQVYIIGGDGTHKGIMLLAKAIKERKLRIALVGVPKTIDNDIQIIDYSFGFSSAVEAAVKAIDSGNVEANCAENGVGLIKLMGRDVGHIAMHASLASRDVNICLVPEFKFDIEGEKGLLKYIFEERLKKKGHCVIAVAEGAALGVRDRELVEKGKDPRAIDIGVYLKREIEGYAKKNGLGVTLKYIDPSYMIRTVPANSADRQFCAVLAQNAVHGAMAGFTNFTCGIIRGISVNLPIELVGDGQKNKIEYKDRAWQRLLAGTGQPSFVN